MGEHFQNLIRHWWTSPRFHGCGAFILAKKLINLRNHLRIWAKTDFGSIKLKKLAYLHEIELLDNLKELQPLSVEELSKDSSLRADVYQILKHEEIYWKQRARISWLQEGNENTNFFHSVANGRKNRNFIPWITHNNSRVSDIKSIGESFTNFYQTLCGTTQDFHFKINWSLCLGAKYHHDLSSLDSPFSHVEIKRAVFELSADKAPGPDGFPIFFLSKILGNH